MTPASELLRKTLGPLLIVSVLGGVVTTIISVRIRPGVDVVETFTVPIPAVHLPERSLAPSEGAIALESLQSSERFADTLAGWLSSPDVVAASYDRAHVSFPGGATVRRLSRAFVSQKRGGSVVEVRFHAQNTEEARALAKGVTEEVQQRVRAFNEAAPGVAFQVSAGEPLIVPVLVSPSLRGLVAALVIFVIALNLVLLWDLLRTPGQPLTH